MNAMRDHLEGRTEEYRVTYRLRRDDGSYVALEDRGSVVERGPGGEPRRVLGTVRPVEAPVEEHP
jgi:PAS domain-containing protein